MGRNRKQPKDKTPIPKSSKGIKVEKVQEYLSTFTTADEIAKFTCGDNRASVLTAVEKALVKLVPPKEKPPEINIEVKIEDNVLEEAQADLLKQIDKPVQFGVEHPQEKSPYIDGESRRFKLVKKSHRGPAYHNGVKLVRGVKYEKGDIVTVTDPGITESEIKRLFGNTEIWEEV